MSDDKKSIKIMAVDPGTVNFGCATFMMDENGNVVLDQMATYKANRHTSNGYSLEKFLEERPTPKINMHGPMGPPGWIPSDAFPPGFPFWDIPTTLMLTDHRLKLRLQMLFSRELSRIKWDVSVVEEAFKETGDQYAAFWSRGVTPFTHSCELVDDFALGYVEMYEPSPEERATVEKWLIKNHHPNAPTYNPRLFIRNVLEHGHGKHRSYAHVDDLAQRRLEIGRWLDYHQRSDLSNEMVEALTPQYKPLQPITLIPPKTFEDWSTKESLIEHLNDYPESQLFGSVERPSPDSVDQFKRKPGWPISSITITRSGVDNEATMGWGRPKKDVKDKDE